MTTNNATIHEDVDIESGFDTIDDAASAFLKRYEDEGTPPPDDEEEIATSETEEDPETSEDDEEELLLEDEEESEEDPSDTDEEESAKKVASDDDEVEIKVGDDTLKASVKDLKRLYGQEAALTRKAQELSAVRKGVETQGLKATATLQKLYQSALDKAKQFDGIDLFKANRELPPEVFEILQKDMKDAKDQVAFFEQEIDGFFKEVQAAQMETVKEQAKAAVQVLQEKIPQWSGELYDEIRNYAVDKGMPVELVNSIVEPSAIILIHEAMLYNKAKLRAQKAKSAVKKAVKKAVPKKVLKSSGNPVNVATKKGEAIKKMRQSGGDIDSAAAAFLARWEEEDG